MAKSIYVGNPETKEFHSIRRQKPECNVKQIRKPVYFKRGRDARDKGFDACGNCSHYWRSRRNRK